MRVAVTSEAKGSVNRYFASTCTLWQQLTDVTPYWRNDVHCPVPDHCVDEHDPVCHRDPDHQEYHRPIAHTPVPDQRDQRQEGTKGSEDWKNGVFHDEGLGGVPMRLENGGLRTFAGFKGSPTSL